MARKIGKDIPTEWRGQKFKTSTDRETKSIYGDKHVNAFQRGARRMSDPKVLYKAKYFERTGKVPSTVPKDFVHEVGSFRKKSLPANLATIASIPAAATAAPYVHPLVTLMGLRVATSGLSRPAQAHAKNVQEIMDRETGKKYQKSAFGGYYVRRVNGKQQRVRKPKRT